MKRLLSAPKDWLPHHMTQGQKFCARGELEAQPPTESMVHWLQKVTGKGARKYHFQQLYPGSPVVWFSSQHSFFFNVHSTGLTSYRKWDLLAAKRARKGCPNWPLSAPEVWLPNHVIQHLEFCAFHKAHFWHTYEGQLPTKMGVTEC